jgi:HEAT repeat protein
MTRLPRSWALAVVLLLPPLALGAERDADERTVREAGVGTDGAALLLFFRNRTLNNTDRDAIAALIKKLGDDSFDEREKASAELIALGPRAERQLRVAVEKDNDAEVRRRAEDCLAQLAKGSDPALLAAAARLLGARKAAGAAAVLLDYLPGAPGEGVADEVCNALAVVAISDGKPDPAVLKALDDKLAARRAAAAVALCRADAKDQFAAVRKLLKDADAVVRLRVAVALALAREKDAVPALIESLADLPPEQAYEAEDLLLALAGDAAPAVTLGKGADERKKARDAWAAWWKKAADKADLTKLAESVGTGRTLLVMRDATPAKVLEGRVVEVGRDGKVRWEITGLKNPVDAQVLPGGRVLVCESSGHRITERNTKGEVLKEIALPANAALGLPIGVQRLPNGNTLVAMRAGVVEMDRDGKTVWSYASTGGIIYAAHKGRNGETVIATSTATCVRLDADGKEVSTFAAVRPVAGGGLDVLANGNVVLCDYTQNKVIEYDAKGKVVWQTTVQRPGAAVRLPNGHTLVACPLNSRVVELDHDGKEVWKCEPGGRPYKVYRR